ncbi:hypothetical protein RHMOL_Rhmol11G0125100 [Rhododendron molle]|uniref:Uncharacterized protein n=1 Tax=Rhododendron molle TaxID=49168 RepID=A0ACC0LRT3_RHOML|nr:hypothetical protein RHMOL_Rhmol11G0125100 [Rhododendron molle]
MDVSGQFIVFSRTVLTQELVGPVDKCQVPFICGRLGLCSINAALDSPVCSCPSNFESSSQNTTHCVPGDGSYSLPVSFTSTMNKSEDNSALVSYLGLGYGVEGNKDFCTEIEIIGNIHHVNLVKLRGFCAQGSERLSVYEYMNGGSLDRTLFGNGPVMKWQERVDIALGAACGLAYSRCGCQQKIIHCDVKPENILLHDNSHAEISYFGLSRLLSPKQSSLYTIMRGTRGYLAPEWLTSSAISDKADVYSFGMILLEIVSGRKNCSLLLQNQGVEDEKRGGGHSPSSSGRGLVYFPIFALEMHYQGRYLELADPRLEGRVSSEEVERLVCVALCCAHEEPALRPTIADASTRKGSNGHEDFAFYPQANAPLAKTRSWLSVTSYLSSQQVSGPR